MRERNAQPDHLVFPNGNGKPNGHFLRKLKAIAKKAGIEGAELHHFRETYAYLAGKGSFSEHHPNSARSEPLDVTAAYLKGKDAESEHANSSSLALHA
jgi:integrase